MMSYSDPSTERICQLLKESSSLTSGQASQARAAFIARLAEARGAEKAQTLVPQGAAVAVSFAAAALVAAVTLVLVFWPDSSLKYQVVGAGEQDGYIRAGGGHAARIIFTDRTVLTAQPSARLRIMELHANGARVLVEEGMLEAEVTHKNSTRWNFVAGPFDVHVTGTKFDVFWDPQSERLLVDLEQGSVEVSGAQDFGAVVVRAGQQFVGDARAHTMQVRDRDPEKDADSRQTGPGPAGDEVAEPTGNAAQEEPSESSTESTASEVSRQGKSQFPGKALLAREGLVDTTSSAQAVEAVRPSFSQLIARGKFKEVVLAAREQGISRCLAVCGSADLMALADAARYTGEDGLVFDSLQAVRKRFPGGTGAKAAFLLGRTHEGRGSLPEARKWYETALEEAPAGAFSGESLAGKMRTISAMNGKGAARAIAEQYLLLYPQGVHANTARQILQP